MVIDSVLGGVHLNMPFVLAGVVLLIFGLIALFVENALENIVGLAFILGGLFLAYQGYRSA